MGEAGEKSRYHTPEAKAYRRMINAVRWICIIPASYLGYYLALIGGMAALVLAESFS